MTKRLRQSIKPDYSFSDLTVKMNHAQNFQKMADHLNMPMFPNALSHVVNAHGRFYGLRSKYDGSGNLRQPMRATLSV